MIVFAYACLRRDFQTLLALQPQHGQVLTPGSVHQMRVATRRLRVELRMFEQMLPGKTVEQFRKDLRWFGRAMGKVRDLDVCSGNLRAYLQEIPPEQRQQLGGYELYLQRARLEARDKLGELFEDERYSSLLSAFTQFLDGAPAPGALRRWRSFRVKDGAGKYLARSMKRVRKMGRRTGSDSKARDLHRLRIRAKRLRYELELFTPIYPALSRLVKGTRALQDMLGAHQDACTATSRLEEYVQLLRGHGVPGAEVPAALEDLLRAQQRNAAEARRAFVPEWRKFERAARSTRLAA